MGRKRTRARLPANVYKRGKNYFVRIWFNGRSIWRKAGTDLRSAQILLGKLREAAAREDIGLPKKSHYTLTDWSPKYLDWALAHKRSFRRDSWCIKQLVEVFGSFKLTDITKTRVDAFMRDRLQQVAPATVNRQVALLRKVLSHAVEAGEIDSNPLRGIKLLPEPAGRLPVLEAEDETKILEACPPWLRFLVQLAVGTGCRQSELLALTWRHVDFDGGEIVVSISKSGQGRRVPVHPTLLEELRSRRGLPDGFVITLPNGKVPSPYSVTDAFRRACHKIGRKDLRYHDLRHVAGTRLLATGANLPEVADFLGHKTLAMARRYAHTSRTRLKELVGRMWSGAS